MRLSDLHRPSYDGVCAARLWLLPFALESDIVLLHAALLTLFNRQHR